MKSYDDPEEIERAKQAAAGPLGDQLSKYPMRFAAGVFIGPTRRSKMFRPNSGTATLVRLNRRPFAVTCAHVIDNYRGRDPEGEAGFWIGNLLIDPLSRLLARLWSSQRSLQQERESPTKDNSLTACQLAAGDAGPCMLFSRRKALRAGPAPLTLVSLGR